MLLQLLDCIFFIAFQYQICRWCSLVLAAFCQRQHFVLFDEAKRLNQDP